MRIIGVPLTRAALILALLILGAWFRFYHLDRKVYGDDEVYTSLRIAGYTRTELKAELRPLDPQGWQRYQRVSADRSLVQVLRALLDDMHPPLYFLIARGWGLVLGSSVWDVRCLSAVISLLAFPCLYWLCRELFESRAVAWVALALLAVSPFHVLYAQEARPYSLQTVAILLSSAALLRAIRAESAANWAFYGVASALALYTHWLSVLLIPGHGLYAWAVSGQRARRVVVGFAAAVALAALTLAPWLALVSRVPGATFTRRAIPATTTAERWLMNVSSVFFDPQVGRPGMLFDVYGRDIGLRWSEASTYVILLVVLLVGYGLCVLCREAPRPVWLFVSVLVGVCLVFLAGPDLVKGGQRSTIGRYMIPAYIGIQLAVAYCLATRTGGTTGSAGRRWAWRAVMAALVSAGVVSCMASSQADTWWNKYGSYQQAEVARFINRAVSPLVLVGGPIPLLGLSHLVHSGVTLQLAEDSFEPPPARFSDIFVYSPSRQFLGALAAQTGYRMTPVYELGGLWQLERPEPRASTSTAPTSERSRLATAT